MVTTSSEPGAQPSPPGAGPARGWAYAGRLGDAGADGLALDGDADLWFDEGGAGRLVVRLGHPVGHRDLALLEDLGTTLPHFRLDDVSVASEFPARHAERFSLARALPVGRFGRRWSVEVSVPPGGKPLPRSVGPTVIPVLATPEAGATEAGTTEASATGVGATSAAATEGRAPEAEPDSAPPADATAPERERRAEAICGSLLALAIAGFVLAFAGEDLLNHQRFGTYGFDLGIFDQGTWLLSRLQPPFVTLRGLPLFGDHASYILIAVAPLYRLWPDPRLLLLLQVIALAVPAAVAYRLALARLGSPFAGLAVAIAYLAFPGMQWAATWQFHPETFAAAFLSLAVLAAWQRRGVETALWLALAMLCKEDVGLVVAGFGGFLWVTGRRRWGQLAVAGGIAWFLLAVFVLIPTANGRSSPHLELNYGITGTGPLGVLTALPRLAAGAVDTAVSNTGIAYLLLVFVPLALLPLLDWRAMLPVLPPLALNLASTHTYQHEIRYQYLATTAPFLAFAAIGGLQHLARRHRRLLAPALVVLVVAALTTSQQYGSAPWARHRPLGAASPIDADRQSALAMVPPDAAVSAQYNLVTHLAHRTRIYEFPNPFRAVNWGFPGDRHDPGDAEGLQVVLVERPLLGKDDLALLDNLQADPDWRTAYDRNGIVLLERAGSGR